MIGSEMNQNNLFCIMLVWFCIEHSIARAILAMRSQYARIRRAMLRNVKVC